MEEDPEERNRGTIRGHRLHFKLAYMPWKEVEPMDEKERFAVLARTGLFTKTQLCLDFGISRKTGHKYLRRYEAEDRDGLKERSRRPGSCPFATVESVEKLILFERRKHPTWGRKGFAICF